jgi:transposase
VAEYAENTFGVRRGVHAGGRWLARQQYTPQKPARKATQQNDAEAERWQTQTFPALQAEAAKEDAEIHFLDEAGRRSDCVSGRSYAPQGQTPKIRVSGPRFRVNFIATLCVFGHLCFDIYTGYFNAEMMIAFLEKFLREREGKKIHLVLDHHPVHTSKAVAAWAAKNVARIRLIFLPKYSPELNPVEYLNNDVKANTQNKYRAKNIEDLGD